jgi:hypothetical protein
MEKVDRRVPPDRPGAMAGSAPNLAVWTLSPALRRLRTSGLTSQFGANRRPLAAGRPLDGSHSDNSG